MIMSQAMSEDDNYSMFDKRKRDMYVQLTI